MALRGRVAWQAADAARRGHCDPRGHRCRARVTRDLASTAAGNASNMLVAQNAVQNLSQERTCTDVRDRTPAMHRNPSARRHQPCAAQSHVLRVRRTRRRPDSRAREPHDIRGACTTPQLAQVVGGATDTSLRKNWEGGRRPQAGHAAPSGKEGGGGGGRSAASAAGTSFEGDRMSGGHEVLDADGLHEADARPRQPSHIGSIGIQGTRSSHGTSSKAPEGAGGQARMTGDPAPPRLHRRMPVTDELMPAYEARTYTCDWNDRMKEDRGRSIDSRCVLALGGRRRGTGDVGTGVRGERRSHIRAAEKEDGRIASVSENSGADTVRGTLSEPLEACMGSYHSPAPPHHERRMCACVSSEGRKTATAEEHSAPPSPCAGASEADNLLATAVCWGGAGERGMWRRDDMEVHEDTDSEKLHGYGPRVAGARHASTVHMKRFRADRQGEHAGEANGTKSMIRDVWPRVGPVSAGQRMVAAHSEGGCSNEIWAYDGRMHAGLKTGSMTGDLRQLNVGRR
ncbi:hypothetical protein DFH08DRAFT_819695 [Mycena albidolilacea]|uniref:Uncharacterized protein n=1 Tax=Mycena albidolilacea TaxID=1033008 RepID=A0AAD6ZDU3_9AGAR|nr:hypothetical protein DFH08DRAFT_819695 [Mycena albidolilacea]